VAPAERLRRGVLLRRHLLPYLVLALRHVRGGVLKLEYVCPISRTYIMGSGRQCPPRPLVRPWCHIGR
jgi:hypothetical protein